MDKRIVLSQNIKLFDENNNEFIVHIKNGSEEYGGSVLSYQINLDQTTGRLKEYYPYELSEFIERNDEGYLFINEVLSDKINEFQKGRERYLNAYQTLLEKINEKKELWSYIPYFRILYASRDKTGTVYIFTPDYDLEVYEKMIRNVQENPTHDTERNLFVILNSILSLTECIYSLHNAGLLHLDIKPSNFGYLKKNNEVDYDLLNLFDIDTLCPIIGTQNNMRETPRYSDPYLHLNFNNQYTIQSDIYSIGVVLFDSLVVLDQEKYPHFNGYQKEYLENIEQYINDSLFINSSPVTSYYQLKDTLIYILKKCLTDEKILDNNQQVILRYNHCQELMEDLEKAICYLVPSHFSHYISNNKRIQLIDVKKYLEQDMQVIFQNLLYNHPLYEYAKETIQVLVAGFGLYGQLFVDQCLQSGQMIDKKLKVTVLYEDSVKQYLDQRPSLMDFFNGNKKNNYGDIAFIQMNSNEYDGILKEAKNCNYIFISYLDNKKNYELASQINNCYQNKSIQYIATKGYDQDDMHSVIIDKEYSQLQNYDRMKELALNTHIVWNEHRKISFDKLLAEFNDKYNLESSLSFALSLKYKLYSLGINADDASAAKLFKQKINKADNLEKIAWIEHRRWVTEKLVSGWTPMDVEEAAANYPHTKDKMNKKHLCILHSSYGTKLDNICHNEWMKTHIGLDDLDNASIQLHQELTKKIDDNKDWLMQTSDFDSIKKIIVKYYHSLVLFSAWELCINSLISGDYYQKGIYSYYKEKFEESLACLSKIQLENTMNYISNIDCHVQPILGAHSYKDYKKIDFDLIEKIPYILTYSPSLHLMIPYVIDNMFLNVCSVLTSDVKEVTYLYELKGKKEFLNSYNKVKKFFDSKKNDVIIHFIILNDTDYRLSVEDFKDSRVKSVINLTYHHDIHVIDKYLDNIYAIEMNKSPLCQLLNKKENHYPRYSFNLSSQSFQNIYLADRLTYIDNKEYLSVLDFTELSQASTQKKGQPYFKKEYLDLWKIYVKNRSLWKKLTEVIEKVVSEKDLITIFEIEEQIQDYELQFCMPVVCLKGVHKIIDGLKKHKIISGNSNFKIDSNYIVITLYIHESNKEKIKLIFNKPISMFMDYSNIDIVPLYSRYENGRKYKLAVRYYNLEYSQLNIDKKYNDILHQIEQKQLISRYSQDKQSFFRFHSFQIKEMLCKAGKLYEIYIYYLLKESLLFDDIENDVTVSCNGNPFTSEIDIILTKGYDSLFVECKATTDLINEYYEKLNNIVNRYGNQTKAVIITDSLEKKKDCPYGIQTFNRGELDNIAAKLLKIMKEGK